MLIDARELHMRRAKVQQLSSRSRRVAALLHSTARYIRAIQATSQEDAAAGELLSSLGGPRSAECCSRARNRPFCALSFQLSFPAAPFFRRIRVTRSCSHLFARKRDRGAGSAADLWLSRGRSEESRVLGFRVLLIIEIYIRA